MVAYKSRVAQMAYGQRFAGGLETGELGLGVRVHASEALLVHSEHLDGRLFVVKDAGGGHDGVDLRVVAGSFGLAEGEYRHLEREAAIQAPLNVNHAAGDLGFQRVGRLELRFEIVAEGEVGLHVFVWHDDGLAGEAVSPGVQTGFLFAFFGFGTGG